jgi:hypothetical protein
MVWRKFDDLASYAKSSLKKESSSERPYPYHQGILPTGFLRCRKPKQ